MRQIFTLIVGLVSPILLMAQGDDSHRTHRPDSVTHRDTTLKQQSPRDSMQGHEHAAMQMGAGPFGIPMNRMGSGTTWLPDAAPMYAQHRQLRNWDVMLHYAANLYYDKQGTSRGDEQFGSINWAMLMGGRDLGGGRLTMRGMMSLEPWTVGAKGYPLLLQTGESYRGVPLHDRQHPHDLFMELGALYERPVTRTIGVSLYLAPVGEPAIGPVAYMHRPSALDDPLAPLGHHWQDATHITFGVITAGVFTRMLKIEGSVFNGREPDENRTNFDYSGRSLDSYAGRITVNPARQWSLSGSYAYLKSPEELEPDESIHRTSASVLYSRPMENSDWSSALVYGANKHSGESRMEHSVLLESTFHLAQRHAIFGRVEFVQKSARDLVLPSLPPDQDFNIGSFVLGFTHDFLRVGPTSGGMTLGVGARGALNVIPSDLRFAYGTRTPSGFAVFIRIRPRRMEMSTMSMPMSHVMPRM